MVRNRALLIVIAVATTIRLYSYYVQNDHSFKSQVNYAQTEEGGLVGEYRLLAEKIKLSANDKIQKVLPSPHSELLMGMLLGVDNLKMVPTFNDVLLSTGTVHIVVVSGYNISLVFGMVIGIIGTRYKMRNLLLAEFVTLVYAGITGMEPPVARAWIMGSIASWGKYYGRSIAALQILIFSGLVMIAFNPEYIASISFQLSFMATLSLILFSGPIQKKVEKIFRSNSFFVSDFSTSLSAQVLVWPIISSQFGRFNLISPLVNCLVLWTVPLATVLGGFLLFLTYSSPLLAYIFSWVVLVPLDIFVSTVTTFGRVSFASLNFEITTLSVILYYLIVFLIIPLFIKVRKRKHK